MADPQLAYSFARAIEIVGPATLRGATTDLPEAAAVAALGGFYTKRIITGDAPVIDALPNRFYGCRRRTGVEIVLDNSDEAIDPNEDWRLSPFTLWHYDRNLGVKRVELTGLVDEAKFGIKRVTFKLVTVDDALLRDPLPAARIDPKAGSPFDDSASPGAPIPVVFGSHVLTRVPSLNVDNASTDGAVSSWDYAAGFGGTLIVEALFGEIDTNRPGLEVYGSWVAVPGSPTHNNPTTWTVTGDQSVWLEPGTPVRFKTTVSGSTYLYSVIASYTAGSPSLVRIEDALSDSGLNTVQVIGDYQVVRHVYQNVTEGLLPVPAEGQHLTAIRMFGQEDNGMLALVSNPEFPSGSGGTSPADIIETILTNPAWGMSSHVQQTTNALYFTVARIALALAGLNGAVQGALAYDGQQRSAELLLDPLLLIARGGRLGRDGDGAWTLTVDVQQAPVATFHYGPGEESGPRIKRIESFGRVPNSQAVRNVVLHWLPLGRAAARANLRLTEYARFSTKAVSGKGRDLSVLNPFIRSQDVAEQVAHYLGEKLKGADEELVFTAGPEARDRVPGEVITVIDTLSGATGDWEIYQTASRIADVTLSCIRHNPVAYDAPSGVVHSAEPSEAPNTRTSPGPGPNLLRNPDPSPPMQIADVFFGDYLPQVPHGWSIVSTSGQLSELSIDKSQAVRERTTSGHYCRMVWDTVDPGPTAANISGLLSDWFTTTAVPADYMISWWGDMDAGWYVVVGEEGHSRRVLPLVRDDTDTDGNGWARLYGRWRSKPGSDRSYVAICASEAGAYEFSGVMVQKVNGSNRKPGGWQRSVAAPSVLTRSALVEFDGETKYTPLIRAGEYVTGVTSRIEEEIVFGWSAAPGSPEYLTDELDPEIRATTFEVTGDDLAEAYQPGTAIRFKTTATFVIDPDSYATSTVVSYSPGIGEPPGPQTVTIADDLIDSGLNSVELQAGEWELGTAVNAQAWAREKTTTAVGSETTGADFIGGSQAVFYPVATSVRVGCPAGAIESGSMTITVSYTRSAPTTGA